MNTTKCNPPPSQVNNTSIIQDYIDELFELNQRQDESISFLIDRLNSLIRPCIEPEKEALEKQPLENSPEKSPMASNLFNLCRVNEWQLDRIRKLINSLEI